MKSVNALAPLLLALPALSKASEYKTYVTSDALQSSITLENLLAGSQTLQDIADANNGNRVFGSSGHNATVDYIVNTLTALDYFDVTKQAFVELFSGGSASLTANAVEYAPAIMTYSPGGTFTAPLVRANSLGCDLADYPDSVSGNVVLISRGNCTFAIKSSNAKSAGAVAALVYNTENATLSGTLGGTGDIYAPIVGLSRQEGNDLIAALGTGEVVVNLVVDTVTENRTTYNVIAETRGGDKENVLMLGAHTDSVEAGPGINDDGSGTIGILNVAAALSRFEVKNTVRFGWWSAEEFGKLGSNYYLSQLNTSDAELARVRAYLNFDMIASPNYVYGIYDGDGSGFNVSGPPGSAEIEKTFEDFFHGIDTPYVPSAFTGRSDYQAFIENGIPAGGLTTGADGVKTEEQAALFGGEVGVIYDPNYHKAGDTIDNLAQDAYLLITKGIAHAVATYATSFDSLPAVDQAERRSAGHRATLQRRLIPEHSHSPLTPCSHSREAS